MTQVFPVPMTDRLRKLQQTRTWCLTPTTLYTHILDEADDPLCELDRALVMEKGPYQEMQAWNPLGMCKQCLTKAGAYD